MELLIAVYTILTLLFIAGFKLVERFVHSRWIGVPLLCVSLGYFVMIFLVTSWFGGALL